MAPPALGSDTWAAKNISHPSPLRSRIAQGVAERAVVPEAQAQLRVTAGGEAGLGPCPLPTVQIARGGVADALL